MIWVWANWGVPKKATSTLSKAVELHDSGQEQSFFQMHFSFCIKIAKVWGDVGLQTLWWGFCKPRRKIQGGTKTPDSLQSSEDAPRNAEENERVKRVSERDRVRSITCVYSRHVSAQKNISLVKQEEGDRHWRIDDHLLGAGQLLTTLFLHARLSKDGKGSEWGFERPVGGEDKS